jgi:hypothetical protein
VLQRSAIFIFMKRDFKGVWIPKHIWLDANLSITEKCLLVEIDSLDNDDKGCFASNAYLGKFLNLSEKRIANMIVELKKRGYIKQVFFDGHNRGLCIEPSQIWESYHPENGKATIPKTGKLPSRKREHNNTVNNTLNNTASDSAPEPTTDNWMHVAQLMSDYVKTEGAAQWKFMCQVTNYKGDPLPLFSNWAGKASPYELSKWKEMIPKLQNWMKNEVKSNPTMSIKKSGKSWGAI